MITAINGFLGHPADWDFLRGRGIPIDTVDLSQIPPAGEVLLGYSMGGRLAIHTLLSGARYRRAVIVSAGLGVEDLADRAARKSADENWARRFEADDWDQLLVDWNAQPVFGGHRLSRRESDFDRRQLADALRRFSPGVLPALAPRLHEIKIPVLWIAGQRDEKYVAEARRAVASLPNAELWICPDAGHRVPWEQPELFVRRLQAL